MVNVEAYVELNRLLFEIGVITLRMHPIEGIGIRVSDNGISKIEIDLPNNNVISRRSI